jgi:hypothetical protein
MKVSPLYSYMQRVLASMARWFLMVNSSIDAETFTRAYNFHHSIEVAFDTIQLR